MRKHFLLLFLMALLPLAGWAAEYSVYVNAKAISVKYGVATPAVSADMFTANLVGTGAGVGADVKEAIAGKLSLSTARLIDSPVSGSYEFTLALISSADATVSVGSDEYTILLQEATNSLVVTKGDGAVVDVAPTLVAATLTYDTTDQNLLETLGSGKIDGTTITGLPLEYSLDGGASWLTGAPTGKDVDSYTVTYRVKETDNYAASAEASLAPKSIGQGTPTLILPSLNTGLTYDGLNHPIAAADGVTTLGAVAQYKVLKWNGTTWVNGSPASADASTLQVKDAGRYKIKGQIAGTTNYSAVAYQSTEAEFVIAPATLKPSIKAGQSKEYGDADPTTFEAEYDGFQNGETATTAAGFTAPTMARVAGENAGVYAISMNQDGAADNYIFDYSLATPVNFSITAKAFTDETGSPFTFTVANPTKPYTGSAVTNSLSEAKFNTQDLVENTDYTIEYKDNVNAGTATMTIKGKGNFKGSVDRTFTIGKGDIYIIPTAATKEYRTSDPTKFAYTLIVGGETVPNSTLHGTVELARVAGENVGTYKIYVVGYTAHATEKDNYTVKNDVTSPVNARPATELADFTITASTTPLVLKFKSTATATKVYGDADPKWSIDDLEAVSGLAGTDTWDGIKTSLGTPVFAIASQNVKDNGTNQVTVSDLVSPAYPTVTVEPMAFTIDAREIAVKVKDQVITYGNDIVKDDHADTYWTITTAGWNGTTADTKADLTLRLYTVNGIGTYAPGSENKNAIKATISDNSNYILKEADCEWGKLTVGGVTPSSVLAMNSDFDSDNDDYTTIIQAYNNQTVTVKITVDRTQTVKNSTLEYTWKGEDWNAFILPFAITPRELSEAFGYAIVNVVNPEKTKDGNVAFKLNMSEEIPANTPFMLKNYTAVAEDAVIDFGKRKIEAPTRELSIPAGEGIQFIGSYKTKVIDKDMPNAYFFNGEGAWKHFGTTSDKSWKIAPFNAYMLMPATGGAREYTFTFEEPDGSTTAIKSISEDATTTIAKGWYTLNGVKMQNTPTQKGVYIKDGKKVVIK